MERVEVYKRNKFTGILSEGVLITKNYNEKITLLPGDEFYSDEIDLNVSFIEDLEIFTYFKEESIVKTSCITWCTDIWTSHIYEGDVKEGKDIPYTEILPFLGKDFYPSRAAIGFYEVALYSEDKVETIAFFGDSITHMSYYSAPLTQMLYRRKPGKVAVINGGIAGNRVSKDAPYADVPGHGKLWGDAGVKRIEKDIFEDITPDILFVLEGVNDCSHSFAFKEDEKATGEIIWNALENVIEIAHSHGTKVIASTIMPFDCTWENWRDKAEAIRQDANAIIRKKCSADVLVDLDEYMRRPDDIHFMQEGTTYPDGVHPNAEGGRKIAKKLLLPILDETVDFREEEFMAIPFFENPVDYPVDTLTEMIRISFKVRECDDSAKKNELMNKFISLRKELEVLPKGTSPIELWPDGKVPTITDYTDNFDYQYIHDPDFKPNLLEVLLPEGVIPKGAILTVAGGEHGMNTLNECYQICKDFNEYGYQGFILNGRPNRGPWSGTECGADAARAIRYIRSNAKRYGIDEDHIAMAGFSNGGIAIEQCIQYFSGNQKMTDTFNDYEPDGLDNISANVNAQICIYGPRHKGSSFNYEKVVYPPTFYGIGRTDFGAIANVNEVYYDLIKRDIPVEIHTFSGHPHGYAGWKIIDGKGDSNFDLWEPLANHFLNDLWK